MTKSRSTATTIHEKHAMNVKDTLPSTVTQTTQIMSRIQYVGIRTLLTNQKAPLTVTYHAAQPHAHVWPVATSHTHETQYSRAK